MGRLEDEMREKIEQFVTAWERKAKSDLRLDAYLDKVIKSRLVDGLVAIFENAMTDLAGQKMPTSELNVVARQDMAKSRLRKKGKAA